MGQADDADTHVLAAHPVSHGCGAGQFEDILVEQGLVVVLLDVVDRFLRVVGEGTALAIPVGAAAAQGRAQPVGGRMQVALQAVGVLVAVPVVAQAVDEALLADLQRVLAVTAVGRVADDVVEQADACAGHVVLVGEAVRARGEALLLRRAEGPALTVEVDLGGDGVDSRLQVEHVLPRVEVHQIEAEAVHLVVHGEAQHRVDHQLLHHLVLGGRVVAARGGVEGAVGVVAVVVAGHNPVQHRLVALAAGGGMVVDHVHHHPQAVLVQGRYHVAKLQDALRAVGVGGVAALRNAVVERIVAPVEAVGCPRRAHRRLLARRVARRRRHGRLGALGCRLDHRGDVEGRQQVDVGQAGVLQLEQVIHAVGQVRVRVWAGRPVVGECLVLATVGLGHRRVVDAEIANVHLVDHDVLEVGQRRLAERVPAGRLQVAVGQVDELAAHVAQRHTVLRQADRVGVADQVMHHGIDRWRRRVDVDLDVEQVELAVPRAVAGHAPHAAGRVQRHGVAAHFGAGRRGIAFQRHRFRCRRPDTD